MKPKKSNGLKLIRLAEENIDIDKLEDAHFEIGKGAFRPKVLHCLDCNKKMKLKEIEVSIQENLYMRLNGFECPKCHKQYLGLGEARKMDKAMILSKATYNDFKMTRSLSFDGDNYTFRIPKEFTEHVHKRKIEIVPLGAKEFCATLK